MSDSANSLDLAGSTPAPSADHPGATLKTFSAPPVASPRVAFDFTSRRALMLALALLGFLAFANSLSGDFVHDDIAQIVKNPMLGHWNGTTLKYILTRDLWAGLQPEVAGDDLNSLYYRPVFSLFLMLVYEVTGRHPAGWHLAVILLHCLCAVLAFIVLDRTLQPASALDDRQRRLVAAVAAAIFAVHPAQAESIAWIAGLVGPLSVIFLLSAFYCYLSYKKHRRTAALIMAMLLFALAMLTKESAIVLILIVAAHEMFILNPGAKAVERLRRAALPVLAFALTGALYMIVRYLVLGVWFGHINNFNFPDDASLTFVDVLRTWPALIVAYGKLIVFPVDLSSMYNFGYVKSLGWTTFWIPLVILLATGLLWLRFAARNAVARLGAIWLVLPLLPHLNTRVFVSDEIIHDRYLYLSLLGAGLLAGALLVQAAGKVRWFSPCAAVGLAAVCLMTLTLLALVTNQRFKNGDALWANMVSHAPHARIPLIQLALSAETHGDKEVAIRAYEAALAINPNILDALNNSAFIYARSGHWDEATRRFERIIELTPDRAGCHFNLAFAYAVLRRYSEAVREQQRAIDLAPNHPRAEEWRSRLEQLKQAADAAAAQAR